MAQNVTIAGNQYPSVPSILIPKTGGGGNATFTDTSPTTASASDVAQGKIFFDSTGTQQTGTASGGSAVIQSLSVTQNGTYTAPTGVDGYSPVTVNVSGGGGGGNEDAIIDRTLSGAYYNSTVGSIGTYAFAYCQFISVNFPNVSTIGSSAFLNCSSLQTVSFPSATVISISAFLSNNKITAFDFPMLTQCGNYAFAQCSVLNSVSLPLLSSIGNNAFRSCKALKSVSLPALNSMGSSCFLQCSALESVYLFNSVVASGATAMFNSTPMVASTYIGHFGSIYVRSSLLSAWKSKAGWSVYSARMVGLTDAQIEALG